MRVSNTPEKNQLSDIGLPRNLVVRSESVRNIIRERRMLEHLSHPFLCNLRYSFQDIEYLYIVVDLMNGGDLRFHISRKTFTEEAVRFWMAQLGCALRYIHKQGIVHRDLKPDNVLLDLDGHVHLADFNVASEFKPEKELHSKSGTLAYLAPEVYAGTGYLSEVDWWSLGVTFYECIYNKRPFEGSNHAKLEKEILKGTPNYPVTQPAVSMSCLHAISSLLEKDKQKRIGALDFQTFTDNPFFRAIDFVALEKKQIAPIFIPSSEKTNFDATYDLEELLLEEAPLEARARRQKPRVQLKDDATDKEIREEELHRMIETLFEPFDYTTIPDFASPIDPSHPSQPPNGSPLQTKASDDQISVPRSGTNSPNGSPPLPASKIPSAHSTQSEYFSAIESRVASPAHVPSLHSRSQQRAAAQAPHRPRGGARTASKGGGVQVVLEATGSWSELNNQNPPVDVEETGPGRSNKAHGMLGFLSRRVRDRSPKPTERGVLGKEGARVVMQSGR
ncbi:hypothetical protein MMC12_001032 [Toensbergia leucococca]|nr:hypothetical protein [Toensbergia leucococca]